MKKALIIASCGLVLALIIGAASQTKGAERSKKIPIPVNDGKCHDSLNGHQQKFDCVGTGFVPREKSSEIFLREIRRKARKVYA